MSGGRGLGGTWGDFGCLVWSSGPSHGGAHVELSLVLAVFCSVRCFPYLSVFVSVLLLLEDGDNRIVCSSESGR